MNRMRASKGVVCRDRGAVSMQPSYPGGCEKQVTLSILSFPSKSFVPGPVQRPSRGFKQRIFRNVDV